MRPPGAAWARLLCVSPQMKLATETMVSLLRCGQRGASLDDLAASLSAQVNDVGDVVLALARKGLVQGLGGPDDRVHVTDLACAVTLADIADAVQDWVLVASCQEDPGPAQPGLSQALLLVAEQVREALGSVSIGGLL